MCEGCNNRTTSSHISFDEFSDVHLNIISKLDQVNQIYVTGEEGILMELGLAGFSYLRGLARSLTKGGSIVGFADPKLEVSKY